MTGPHIDRDQEAKPRRRAWRIVHLVPVVIFLGVVSLFLSALLRGNRSELPSPLVGRAAPAFSLPALPELASSSGPVPGLSRADLLGKVTVLNVWASWCGPCRQEHPVLMQLAQDSSMRVVGINYKDKPANARRFLETLGNPYEAVGVDESGRSAIDWGVYGIPETFIISPDGVILYKHVGPLLPEQLPGFLAKVNTAAGK